MKAAPTSGHKRSRAKGAANGSWQCTFAGERAGHRAAILRFQGVNFGSTNAKRDIPMYAELYLQGRMNLDDLVSKRISLREVDDAYAALKDGSLTRVVVTSF